VVYPLAYDPDGALHLTHSICPECAEQLEREEVRIRGRALIIVRRSARALQNHLEAISAGLADVTVRMDRRVEERRRPAEPQGRNRRQHARRRALSPSQAASWRALGMFVAR
jgi:hypothetical protein